MPPSDHSQSSPMPSPFNQHCPIDRKGVTLYYRQIESIISLIEGGLPLKYTKATNYALHLMAYLIKEAGSENVTLQPLASHMNISPTYLSKILTQLVKADLVHSTPGVNGGYSLRKPKADISFYDVIVAIEGSGALFTCEMGEGEHSGCKIEAVMKNAEAKMVAHLKEQKISDLF